jgi:hypothetical protein
MGFLVTTLIFFLAGIVASLFALLCCNRGPSTNLYARLSLLFSLARSVRSSLPLIRDFFLVQLVRGMGFGITLVGLTARIHRGGIDLI